MAGKVVHFRNVALLRRREGLTQEQLAGLMNTTQQSVNRWETGAGTPNLKKAVASATRIVDIVRAPCKWTVWGKRGLATDYVGSNSVISRRQAGSVKLVSAEPASTIGAGR